MKQFKRNRSALTYPGGDLTRAITNSNTNGIGPSSKLKLNCKKIMSWVYILKVSNYNGSFTVFLNLGCISVGFQSVLCRSGRPLWMPAAYKL